MAGAMGAENAVGIGSIHHGQFGHAIELVALGVVVEKRGEFGTGWPNQSRFSTVSQTGFVFIRGRDCVGCAVGDFLSIARICLG